MIRNILKFMPSKIHNLKCDDVFKMNHSLKKTISLVIPVYNEAANIELLYKELNATLLQIRHAYDLFLSMMEVWIAHYQ